MCFGKLADFKGSIDITFFPKTWEEIKDKVEDGGVYAFKGKVDGSREQPSLIVDSLEDPKALEERAISQLHIELEDGFQNAGEISSLKDVLLGSQGNCSVFFHIDVNGLNYIVKGNSQMRAPSGADFIQQIKDQPLVKDVWTE